jgi:hypothetical protein
MTMYVGDRAKQFPPGILYAPLHALSEEARMGYVDVQNAMRQLIDTGTVLHDRERRVVLFTSLPDQGERPSSGKVLTAFWTRWKRLPECELKYKYIALLEWLVGDIPTQKYQKTWDMTFGTALDGLQNRVREGVYDRVSGSVSNPTKEADLSTARRVNSTESGKTTPPDSACAQPVDNFSVHEQKQLFGPVDKPEPDRVSHRVSYTLGKQVVGSRLGVSVLEGESEGGTPQRVNRGRDLGPAATRGMPPPQLPFTVAELLDTIAAASAGRVSVEPLDPRTGDELWRVVKICDTAGVTLADVTLAGEFLAAGHLAYRGDLDARWLARSGSLLGVVSKARLWEAGGRLPLAKSGRRTPSQDRGPTAQDFAARAAKLEAEGL